MTWGKAEQAAYQREIEQALYKLPAQPHRPALCTVRMGQPCDFRVPPTNRCWYCLLTREQIAAGLSLRDVLVSPNLRRMMEEIMPMKPEEVPAHMGSLNPPNKLRLAASLMEAGRLDLASAIVAEVDALLSVTKATERKAG